MKRFVSTLVIFTVLLLGGGSQVFAHSTDLANSEHIQSFDSDISISKENVATITETIHYDFAYLDRHGIYRYIPTRTKAGDSGKYYYYDFDFLQASYDGGPVQVKESKKGDYAALRFGDPNKTITGIHTYTITYTISPVVERDKRGDYFNWNITGNDWEVPIESSAA